MDVFVQSKFVVAALVYSALGMVILWFSFFVFDKLTPGDLWTHIVDEKNIAFAIVTAAFTLAIAQIIAAAIHG